MHSLTLVVLAVTLLSCSSKSNPEEGSSKPEAARAQPEEAPQPASIGLGKLAQASDEAKDVHAYALARQFGAAYARWSLDNEDLCPGSLNDLVKYATNNPDAKDPWGGDYVMVCGPSAPPEADGFGVVSKGKDGKQGTDDDVVSWQRPGQ